MVLAADCWNGAPFLVAGFVEDTGITFPVLLDASIISVQYGIPYDNYVVIDPEGIVRYTSLNEVFTGLGTWNDTAVRAVLDQNLPTAVERHSWSVIKDLYRD